MSLNSSSSITADEFIPGRKLEVHNAENGHSFIFTCDGSTPVEALQRHMESLSGVQFADQLLMCGNISLEPPHPLAYYKLPQDDCEVFLYNKARFHADSPRPSPENTSVPKAAPPPQSHDPHPLDGVSNPALKALAHYERSFRYHFQYANAFYVSTQEKFELCHRLLREQQVQERAVENALGNMDHNFKKLQHKYSEFIKRFTHQHKVHTEILNNLDRDVERLRRLKLHPSVQSDGRKCLLDLVKVDLGKWREICLNSHTQLESKVSQLKVSFGALKKRVEDLLSGMSSRCSSDLEGLIWDHQKVLNDQKAIMQTLSKDVNIVKKLVDDSLSNHMPTSLGRNDAISALGPTFDFHENNYLPKVQNCDNLIEKLLNKCKRGKDHTNLLVHESLQKVKSAQTSIIDLRWQLPGFEEVMMAKEKEFENIKKFNGVGQAYRACLAEVVRRKSSLKLYMGLAGQLAERIAIERESEIRRRDGFYKAWSKYVPQDMLAAMGLFDSPSQCDVNMAPFDSNLLEIDVADVDRYAPQSLLGFPLKSDQNKSSEINAAASSESSNFNKTEENVGFLEGCESVEIAGTSKIEVENARLKAELASAIALICTFNAGFGYDPFGKGEPDEILKIMKEKTAEALQLKDEYVDHLQSMLNSKQDQCSSYEKRIQELEQRLEEKYVQGQKLSAKDASDSVLSIGKADGYSENQMPCISTVSMDESSSASKHDLVTGQASRPREGGDESMTDLSGIDSARNFMDASMQETPRDEQQVRNEETKLLEDANKENSSDNTTKDAAELSSDSESKTRDVLVLDLQNALTDKSNQLSETENQLKVAMEEIVSLRRELGVSQTLLDESQMNCAHLENCLHEAREEACTNLCAADRRASEYSALRTTAVKMHGLFERFRSCVTAQVGVANFADTLRSLALSLASSVSEDEDDGTAEFRLSIKVLSDKVDLVSRYRTELLERCSRAESAMEEKTDQIKSLYTKLQLEKQASKAKISFVRLEVRELACFVLNSSGHYEAIHRSCPNYYLSSESVALFTEQYSGRRPAYIIGQIVHIERRIAKMPAPQRSEIVTKVDSMSSGDTQNPYGLQAVSEYFIVTVAMLPDTICSSPS